MGAFAPKVNRREWVRLLPKCPVLKWSIRINIIRYRYVAPKMVRPELELGYEYTKKGYY